MAAPINGRSRWGSSSSGGVPVASALPFAALRASFVKQAVSPLRSLDAREAGFPQMHAGDQEPFRADLVQKPRSCGGGNGLVLIECNRDIRALNLDVREMHDVPPDESGSCRSRGQGLGTRIRLIISDPDKANSSVSGCSVPPQIRIWPSHMFGPIASNHAATASSNTRTIDVGIGVPSK